jgi:hypothetical protein
MVITNNFFQEGGQPPATGTTVPPTTVPSSGFSDTPPPPGSGGSQDSSSGQYGLDSDFEFPARTVSLPKIKLGNETGYETHYFGSTDKTVYDKGYTATGSEDWVYNATYVGPLLVDYQGRITREPYDVDISTGDVWPVISSFTDGPQRDAFLSNLYNLGLYSYGEPSRMGSSDADMNAVQQFLLIANTMGRTADVALSLLNQRYPGARKVGTTGRRAIQYTSAKDLEQIMRSVSQQVLGRTASDEDVQRFIQAYQGSERSAQTGGSEAAPAADVAAQAQIQEQYGSEAQAVGFNNLARIMESLIKGG